MKPLHLTLISALLCVVAAPCWSQNAGELPAIVPALAPSNSWHPISMRYVKPSLMAFWLDSAHYTETGEHIAGLPLDKAPQKGVFALPSGVEAIVPVDAQNVLLVQGTPEGATQITSTIQFLDRPLRQVEIEARFVEGNAKNMDALWKKIAGGSPIGTGVSFIGDRERRELEEGQLAGRFKIVANRRVTAINNLSAELNRTSSQNAGIGVRGDDGKFEPVPEVGTTSFVIESTSGMKVTPTINNDDTITLLLDTSTSQQLRAKNGSAALPLEKKDGVKAVVNVRDGATVALWNSQTKQIVLVTARIIRRAGE